MIDAKKDNISAGISNVKHIILVLSGKGGVGKSTVASQLAIGFWKQGFKVGLLDVDLCGPSIPRMLGLTHAKIRQCSEGWLPVIADASRVGACGDSCAETQFNSGRFRVVSMSFLMEDTDNAVVWRGPRKSTMVGQLLESVCWGPLDVLLVDTPPGTSDEHLSILEQLQRSSSQQLTGAIIVTTPQRVALCDVRRELGFCTKTNLPVLGIVENMSGYRCPHCSHCANLFSSGGGEALAAEKQLNFFGRLSFDPQLTLLADSADDFEAKAVVTASMQNIVDRLMTDYNILKTDVDRE